MAALNGLAVGMILASNIAPAHASVAPKVERPPQLATQLTSQTRLHVSGTPGSTRSGSSSYVRVMKAYGGRGDSNVVTPAPSQYYYWTDAWQREEQRAVTELATGEYRDFDTAEDVIAWLHEDDE